jgi:hypothetical protein
VFVKILKGAKGNAGQVAIGRESQAGGEAARRAFLRLAQNAEKMELAEGIEPPTV